MSYLASRNQGLAGWSDSIKSLLSKTDTAVSTYSATKAQEAATYQPGPSILTTYKIPILAALGVAALLLTRKMKTKKG